jgi:trigger factor
MSVGQESSFPLALPEEGFGDRLSGKTVDFRVTLKEIKEKILPRVSDQWASEVSEFATLLELRTDIRSRLQAVKAQMADQQFRSAALAKAVDNVTIELPDVVVKRETAEMLTDFKNSLESRGASLEGYLEATGVTFERMVQDLVPQAASNVKTRLVLTAVAKAEGLEVSDEELAAVLGRMATANKVDIKSLEVRLSKNGRLELLKEQLLDEKAADLIVKSAVVGPPGAEGDAGKPAVAKKRREAGSASEKSMAGAKKPVAKKPVAKKPVAKKPATEEASVSETEDTTGGATESAAAASRERKQL